MIRNEIETTTIRSIKALPYLLRLLCSAFLITGCGGAEAPKTPPPPVVQVADVVQRDIPVSQEWVGTLDGMINAQILAQVTGYLIKQHYMEGEPVKKGDLLYEIDPRTFTAALDGARSDLARQQAELKTAQLDLRRIQRLLPEKAVSVRDLDSAVGREAKAKANVLAAQAAVERTRLELEFTQIRSPIDGIAGLSKTQLGNLVGPGSANAVLTTISQVDPIKAFIPLSEQQYLRFASELNRRTEPPARRKLELVLADGSTYPSPGRFYFADRQVDVNTGTIQIAVLFDNPGNLLRPGQFAKIRAVEIDSAALLIPQRAIKELQGKFLVAVVKPDNRVNMRTVTPGQRIDSWWQIKDGLQAGERVVVEGSQKMREGMTVIAKPYETPVERPVVTPAG